MPAQGAGRGTVVERRQTEDGREWEGEREGWEEVRVRKGRGRDRWETIYGYKRVEYT